MKVPFTQPFVTGNEVPYIQKAIKNNKLSGDGEFTRSCEEFLRSRYNCPEALLTTSCTDALEMCATLCSIAPGDEVIVPSFTFITSVSAFESKGAKIIFCDSLPNHPNMDTSLIEGLITNKTKAIVAVHYGGHPCDMDAIMKIAEKKQLIVIEDAAQAIESNYQGQQLGTIGHLGTFSFHDTKNISAGEGGALLINDQQFIDRAHIIRDKGTNRRSFLNGKVDKYGWVDQGSSHLPSELNAAFLLAQLQSISEIQDLRVNAWNYYNNNITQSNFFSKPSPKLIGNAHVYYLTFQNKRLRDDFLHKMNSMEIGACFHFLPLDKSEYISNKYGDINTCANSAMHSEKIARLPLHSSISKEQLDFVVNQINTLS